MEPEISLKNTKNEILEAYPAACKKLEEWDLRSHHGQQDHQR